MTTITPLASSGDDQVRRVLSYVLVASLWGITNPLLKKATTTTTSSSSSEPTMFGTFKSLLMDPNKLLPFVANQCGSLMFYYLLASEPVMIAAPLCNALTFAITAIAAYCLGEKPSSPALMFSGVLLVLLGIYVSFLA